MTASTNLQPRRQWRSIAAERLGVLAKSGSAIVLTTVVLSNLIRIVSSMTLTRLLDASAFGVVGILASISFILAIMSDVGILPFVVRHENAGDRRFLDEVWSVRLVRSAALTFVMVLLAAPIAAYSGKPELRWPIIAWSFTFMIDGLSSMAFSTAVRGQQLKRLNGLELATALIQLICSIILAIFMRSYWAIIIASLLSGGAKSALSYALFADTERRFAWSRARVRELWTFSRFITASGLVSLLLSQTDKLVFARMMSLADFGVYSLATTLAAMPLAFVGSYTHQVLYPTYARHTQHTDRIRAYYGPTMRIMSLYIFGVSIYIGLSSLLISVLYDHRYQQAALYLQILSITPLLAMNTWSSDQFMIAFGKPKSIFVAHVIRAGWLIVMACIGWFLIGPIGVAIAVGTIDVPAWIFFCARRYTLNAFSLRRELVLVCIAGTGVLIGQAVSHIAAPMHLDDVIHRQIGFR